MGAPSLICMQTDVGLRSPDRELLGLQVSESSSPADAQCPLSPRQEVTSVGQPCLQALVAAHRMVQACAVVHQFCLAQRRAMAQWLPHIYLGRHETIDTTLETSGTSAVRTQMGLTSLLSTPPSTFCLQSSRPRTGKLVHHLKMANQ